MSRERGLTTEAPLNTRAVAAGAQRVWLQVDDADAWTLDGDGPLGLGRS